MKPLIIVRPQPAARASLEAARALGLNAQAHPIFTIRPVPWVPVNPQDVDAVVLGSANAIRHAGPALDGLRGMPAYCVGKTTATVAEHAGLSVIRVGSGGLQNVLNTIEPQHRRLLRLAGVTRLELTPPAHISMITREVYSTEPISRDSELLNALQQPCVVMLHSGEAAAHFAAICTDAAINTMGITLAAIAPRVAEIAENFPDAHWAHIAIADSPSDTALLALAYNLCQEAAGDSGIPR